MQLKFEDWLAQQQGCAGAADSASRAEALARRQANATSSSPYSAAFASHSDHETPAPRDEHSLEFCDEAVDFQKRIPASRSLLRAVQKMLDPGRVRRKPAVCLCGSPRKHDVDVHLIDKNGTSKASITGIWRCKNGEVCPHCSEIVAAERATRHKRVANAVTGKGGRILTVVLTVAHDPGDKLADVMTALKKASTGARSGGTWTRKIKRLLRVAGVLIDAHTRWSAEAGWHYHQHVTIACLSDNEDEIREGAKALIDRYVELIRRAGYDADAERQWVSIVKSGAAETTPYNYPADHHRPHRSDGDLQGALDEGTSLSPLQIAELAAAGDEAMAERFREFAKAVRGTKSAIVTAKMSKALCIEDADDEKPALDESTRLGSIPGVAWMRLLDQNLNGTFLSRVEAAGRPGWDAVRWWAVKITGCAPEIIPDLVQEIVLYLRVREEVTEPGAGDIAQHNLEQRIQDWTRIYGHDLIAATIDFAYAHERFVAVDANAVTAFANSLYEWADKYKRRQGREYRKTPPPTQGEQKGENVGKMAA